MCVNTCIGGVIGVCNTFLLMNGLGMTCVCTLTGTGNDTINGLSISSGDITNDPIYLKACETNICNELFVLGTGLSVVFGCLNIATRVCSPLACAGCNCVSRKMVIPVGTNCY